MTTTKKVTESTSTGAGIALQFYYTRAGYVIIYTKRPLITPFLNEYVVVLLPA